MLVVGLLTGLAVGLIVCLVDTLVYTLIDGPVFGLEVGLLDGLLNGLTAGLAFGLAHGVVLMFRAAALEPSRVQVRIRGRTRPSRASPIRRFVTRPMVALLLGLVFGVGTGLVFGLVSALLSGFVVGLKVGVATAVVFGPLFGLGAWLVVGLGARFETPIDISSAASPAGLLNTNRTTVVLGFTVLAPVFGLVAGFGLVPVFETARMYRGQAPALPLQAIYSITTLELG